ncbi:serine hydrolase domain-containing protein [Lentibacillus sp. N15]|uniref:serine hydrolase domain-containing protein n=1 Tax=Lentibacillus songyuanensis TaxID=3136161 RepID=UPI0031BB876A
MKQKTEMQDFEQYCGKILKKYNVPGFAIGLAKDGELTYENGFGFRDMEKALPLSPDTVFGIGSITKAFTAVAILQLQEKGKLSVNDLVTSYLPEFKLPNERQTKQLTVHHFLTHSSGLPSLPTLMGAVKSSIEKDPAFAGNQQEDNPLDALQAIDTYEALMKAIANAPFMPLGEPGCEFSYSNDGYGLLGAIIERVSDKSYEQYVQENILSPAGMFNSSFQLENSKEHEDIAVLYDMQPKNDEAAAVRSNHPWDAPAMRAAGFLKSTVNDMLRFMEVIRNDGKVDDVRILSPESVRAMTTPYIQSEPGAYYGYGLMIIPDFFGYKLIHHGGDMKGVTAQMNILPEIGLTGVSLANLAGAPSSKLLFSAFADHLGKPLAASHINAEQVDVVPESLSEYEGTFVSGDGMRCAFDVKDKQLHMGITGLLEAVLTPIGHDLFLFNMREMDFTIRFMRNENNEVHRVAFASRQIPKVNDDEGATT